MAQESNQCAGGTATFESPLHFDNVPHTLVMYNPLGRVFEDPTSLSDDD